ncbi:MAG: RluA family pseudouridine synthase [Calditrichia bacterium]
MLKKIERFKLLPVKSERLDALLPAMLPEYSRRFLRALILQGGVYVDKKRVRKQGYMVRANRSVHIKIYIFDGSTIEALAKKVLWQDTILHQANSFVAVNKPSGIPTAPTESSSVHNLYAYLNRSKLVPPTAFPGNRLDRYTSGVVIIPLTRRFSAKLNEQLANRSIPKKYLALVSGLPEKNEWKIEGYMSRSQHGKMILRADKRHNARYSCSRFSVLATNREKEVTLVAAMPETGRTHQIRVHLLESGLPIIGDSQYGKRRSLSIDASRMMLHCYQMDLAGVEEANTLIVTEIPEEFTRIFNSDISL